MPHVDVPTTDTLVNWNLKGLEGCINILQVFQVSCQPFRPPHVEQLIRDRDRLTAIIDRYSQHESPPA